MMETILNNIATLLFVVAVICTIVSVITEFTKEIGFLKKIPTKLQVLVLTLLVTFLAFFSYMSYAHITFYWYYAVAVTFAGFIIAVICCNGWDFLFNIWKKFYKKDLE